MAEKFKIKETRKLRLQEPAKLTALFLDPTQLDQSTTEVVNASWKNYISDWG